MDARSKSDARKRFLRGQLLCVVTCGSAGSRATSTTLDGWRWRRRRGPPGQRQLARQARNLAHDTTWARVWRGHWARWSCGTRAPPTAGRVRVVDVNDFDIILAALGAPSINIGASCCSPLDPNACARYATPSVLANNLTNLPCTTILVSIVPVRAATNRCARHRRWHTRHASAAVVRVAPARTLAGFAAPHPRRRASAARARLAPVNLLDGALKGRSQVCSNITHRRCWLHQQAAWHCASNVVRHDRVSFRSHNSNAQRP
mmetsp:Transcript_11520/g.40222  ORF Transcript_11520/g.40222 Transcript_11520/m.40222 type:complete len:261 (-) Transcript_11520:3452-4234(-)